MKKKENNKLKYEEKTSIKIPVGRSISTRCKICTNFQYKLFQTNHHCRICGIILYKICSVFNSIEFYN